MRPLVSFFEIEKDRNAQTCLLKVEIEDLYRTNRQVMQNKLYEIFQVTL